MATSKKSKKNKKGTTPPRKLPKSLRKGALPTSVSEVWAAGLGALGQARKKGGDTFEGLVARGERVVRAGSDAAREALGEVEAAAAAVTGRVRETTNGAGDLVQRPVERAVEGALSRLGVPTREEVAALQAMVDRLEAQLSALGAGGAAPEAAAYEVVKHDEGWAVRHPGGARALAVVKTKKEAVRDARALARDHAPSRLTVYNLDGSVGDVTEYGAE